MVGAIAATMASSSRLASGSIFQTKSLIAGATAAPDAL
jgi:hypothetical protein